MQIYLFISEIVRGAKYSLKVLLAKEKKRYEMI